MCWYNIPKYFIFLLKIKVKSNIIGLLNYIITLSKTPTSPPPSPPPISHRHPCGHYYSSILWWYCLISFLVVFIEASSDTAGMQIKSINLLSCCANH